MSRFSAENETALAALEQHLAAHDYLGGDSPNAEDSRIFTELQKNQPNKDLYPNLYFWFYNLSVLPPVVFQALGGTHKAVMF